LTNYPKKFTVYKSSGTDSGTSVYLNGHCQDDFDDIRWYDATGTNPMDYWRETYTSGTSAVFWVEFDSIAASPALLILGFIIIILLPLMLVMGQIHSNYLTILIMVH